MENEHTKSPIWCVSAQYVRIFPNLSRIVAPSRSSQARAVALCLSTIQTYVYSVVPEVQSDTKHLYHAAPPEKPCAIRYTKFKNAAPKWEVCNPTASPCLGIMTLGGTCAWQCCRFLLEIPFVIWSQWVRWGFCPSVLVCAVAIPATVLCVLSRSRRLPCPRACVVRPHWCLERFLVGDGM